MDGPIVCFGLVALLAAILFWEHFNRAARQRRAEERERHRQRAEADERAWQQYRETGRWPDEWPYNDD